MAKRKAKRKMKSRAYMHAILQFFLPTSLSSVKDWLWFFFSRIGLPITTFFIVLVLVFSIVPVPFSAYMAQKKVENLWNNQPYKIQYQWVSLDKISWPMQMAVIASEDQKFDSHFGIDLYAIQQAIKRNAKTDKKAIGASTITQQTVKNLYLWHGTSWIRKGLEVPLTLLTESLWSKKRVLEVYLNIAEFGQGIFGVEAAAQYYFKKPASKLSLQESALLAASLPNPIIYRVKSPSQTMRNRQQWIIRQVQNLGGQNYLDKL